MAMAGVNHKGLKTVRTANVIPAKSEDESRSSTTAAGEKALTPNTSEVTAPAPKHWNSHTGLPRPRKPIPTAPNGAASTQPSDEASEGLAQLQYYTTLLQQLHVRHKNQHRGQLWFKHLSLLRRALRNLLEVEIELHNLRHTDYPPASQRVAVDVRRSFEREQQLMTRREELRSWIGGVLVPEGYVRFSVLVEEGGGSFAGLGVVLVAIVAGVGGLMGMPLEDGNEEERAEEQREADAKGGRTEDRGDGMSRRWGVEMDLDGDDLGTVVERRKATDARVNETLESPKRQMEETYSREQVALVSNKQSKREDAQHISPSGKPHKSKKPTLHKSPASPTDAKVKKKGKKKNAIDDLFAGFT